MLGGGLDQDAVLAVDPDSGPALVDGGQEPVLAVDPDSGPALDGELEPGAAAVGPDSGPAGLELDAELAVGLDDVADEVAIS